MARQRCPRGLAIARENAGIADAAFWLRMQATRYLAQEQLRREREGVTGSKTDAAGRVGSDASARPIQPSGAARRPVGCWEVTIRICQRVAFGESAFASGRGPGAPNPRNQSDLPRPNDPTETAQEFR